MNEELLKLAYQSLKRQFDNISKDSWIWTDFFEDEKVGFDYFKKQIEQDEDFAYLQDETYYLDEDLDELAKDYSTEFVKLQHKKGITECGILYPDVVSWSVELADALIKKLKVE